MPVAELNIYESASPPDLFTGCSHPRPALPILASTYFIRMYALHVRTIAPEISTELHIMVRQIQHRLRQARRLHNAADLDGALVLDEFADDAQEAGRELPGTSSAHPSLQPTDATTDTSLESNSKESSYLGVPPILPGNQPNQPLQHILVLVLLLPHLRHGSHRLRAESDPQAALVRFDRLGRMVQPLRQVAQDLPLLGALVVGCAGVVRVWRAGGLGGGFGAGHVRAPDGVDA